MVSEKRFITDEKSMFLIEKVTYEKWCNHLFVSSYFVSDEVMKQINRFYPTSIII